MRVLLTLGTSHCPFSPCVNVCALSELVGLGVLQMNAQHLGDVVVVDSYIVERQVYTLVEATVRWCLISPIRKRAKKQKSAAAHNMVMSSSCARQVQRALS